MKTAKDPRHIKRIKLIQELFSWQFMPKDKTPKNMKLPASGGVSSPRSAERNPPKSRLAGRRRIKEITANISKIDKLIAKSAPGRPIEQINRIDLAILRLAVFELIIKKEVPPKVVIDEAVELGKEFGSDSSASFINGALGKLVEIKKVKT